MKKQSATVLLVPVKRLTTAPGNFESVRLSTISRARVRIDSAVGYLERLL